MPMYTHVSFCHTVKSTHGQLFAPRALDRKTHRTVWDTVSGVIRTTVEFMTISKYDGCKEMHVSTCTAPRVLCSHDYTIDTLVLHLVRLGDVGEYSVHHSNEHAVLERVSCILDDRDDVRTRLGHVDQVPSGAVGKFHRVNAARRPYDIGDMRNSGACCRTQVQHLCYKVGNSR